MKKIIFRQTEDEGEHSVKGNGICGEYNKLEQKAKHNHIDIITMETTSTILDVW